jgi:hypothetical protein
MNYLIVVFKNKRKKKIINKFNTSKGAQQFYKKLLEENNEVDFEIQTQNGKPCQYEVALLEKKSNQIFEIYTKDEFGRNIKLDFEDDNYNIIKISSYKESEKILDLQTNNKIEFSTFFYKYLPKDGIKLVSKLNNKIIVQNDDDLNLFVLKSDDDARRFIESLVSRFIKNKRGDAMFVMDSSTPQKKELYKLLESKGYKKSFLYRKETTYSSRNK